MEGTIRTGVCFFCHDGKGNYLISKRSKNARDEQETWDPGGGGLKFGEKIEEALIRELKEEYVTVPKAFEFLGYRDVFREQNSQPTHWLVFDFRVLVDPSEVQIGEPHKCDGIKWLTIDEIKNFDEPLHSQFPPFFEKYDGRFT